MAFLKIENIRISGISACVPKTIVENNDSNLFGNREELASYISSTGVERRHVASNEQCASDLCYEAAKRVIEKLNWEKSEIEILFFVSQTHDYIYPATACILQNRLGLSEDCMCMDISMGCPGWVYGLSSIASVMSASKIKKGLLLVGETVTKTRSPYDRINLISGDAGTCTALEYDEDSSPMLFDMHTDGSGAETIIIPSGGFRNMTSINSFEYNICEDGIKRTSLHTHMDGAGVFSFAISRVPKSINRIIDYFTIDKSKIDLYIFHQANHFINKKIQKKLQIEDSKMPMNLKNYGNTSSTSIPLNIVCNLKNNFDNKNCIACGFGVGLSWATVYFNTNKVIIPDIIEI